MVVAIAINMKVVGVLNGILDGVVDLLMCFVWGVDGYDLLRSGCNL